MGEQTLPAIIKPWAVSKEEYTAASEGGKMLRLLLDLSAGCALSCTFCSTKREISHWSAKGKKRLEGEMSHEDHLHALDEAVALGVKYVDIIGAGEPLSDQFFDETLNAINERGMEALVFTHAGFDYKRGWEKKYVDRNVSFVVKMWSRDPAFEKELVQGAIKNYSEVRDAALTRMMIAGYNAGEEKKVDGIQYKTTRLGLDWVFTNGNLGEEKDVLRYARRQNLFLVWKTMIPSGGSNFDPNYDERHLHEDTLDYSMSQELTPKQYLALREELAQIDKDEFGIAGMEGLLYPGFAKCGQDHGLYLKVNGAIEGCPGNNTPLGMYKPGQNALKKALDIRLQNGVSFNCPPRYHQLQNRDIAVPEELERLYMELPVLGN